MLKSKLVKHPIPGFYFFPPQKKLLFFLMAKILHVIAENPNNTEKHKKYKNYNHPKCHYL